MKHLSAAFFYWSENRDFRLATAASLPCRGLGLDSSRPASLRLDSMCSIIADV